MAARATFVLTVLLVLANGCAAPGPKPVRTTAPAPLTPAAIESLADVLRAETRRHVDDGLRSACRSDAAVVRARAVRAIGRIGDLDEIPLVRLATEDAAPDVRAAAVVALARLRDGDLGPVLDRTAADASPMVREACALAIALAAPTDAAARIRALLDDADGSVRAAAAGSAGRLRLDEETVARLSDRTLETEDPEVRVAATRGLADVAEPQVSLVPECHVLMGHCRLVLVQIPAVSAHLVTDDERQIRIVQITRHSISTLCCCTEYAFEYIELPEW